MGVGKYHTTEKNMNSNNTEINAETINKITLLTNNGGSFPISEETAKLFKTTEAVLAQLGPEQRRDIPLPEVSSEVLEMILEFAKANLEGKEFGTSDLLALINKVNADRKISRENLISVVTGSNYLEYAKLLDVSTSCVADTLRGKTAQQIREEFNIVNDFDPEEEAALRKELHFETIASK